MKVMMMVHCMAGLLEYFLVAFVHYYALLATAIAGHCLMFLLEKMFVSFWSDRSLHSITM